MAEVFANPLVDLAEYTDMKQDLDQGKGPVQISGVTDSQKVHVMHELSKDNPWRLVVTYDDTRAKEIFDDFSYFGAEYLAVSGKGSSVLQLGYPRKSSDKTENAGF